MNATSGRPECDPFGTITMKTLATLAVAGVALLGLVACDSKAGSGAVESKTEALEHKAEIARKDAKEFAAEAAKEAIIVKAEAMVKADAEKKAVEEAADKIRKSGEQNAKGLDEKAGEIRKQK